MTSTSLPMRRNRAPAPARDTRRDRLAESTPAGREQWVASCAARLLELRPHHDRLALGSIASEMWGDVGAFDPVIAAELECEAWPPEH